MSSTESQLRSTQSLAEPGTVLVLLQIKAAMSQALSEPGTVLVLLQIKAAMRKGSTCAMFRRSNEHVYGIFVRPAHCVWHK